jgi:hydrogenase 3 maturation protease
LAKESDFEEELRGWLANAGKVAVAGIGNPIRKDDFIGVKVIRDLRGRVSKRVYLIECGTVPESYMQRIIDFKPSHILLVNAAAMGLKPGEYHLRKPEHLKVFPPISTHMLPLRFFCDYLAYTIGAQIALILVEPKDTGFGEGLSPEVEDAERKIVDLLLRMLPR